MAITATAVGTASTAAGTTVTISAANAVPAGDLVVVVISTLTNSATRGVTDTRSNTWQEYGAYANGAARQNTIFFSVLTTALQAADSINVDPANATSTVIGATSTAFHAPGGFVGTSATVADKSTYLDAGTSATALSGTATATLAQADELAFASFLQHSQANTYTPGGGWTQDPTVTSSAFTFSSNWIWNEYQETAATTAVTATATQSLANGYSVMTVTFKVAAAPPSFVPSRMPLGV